MVENYDRAAPKGVGAAKVAGNYAADILPNTLAKKKGFPIALYLDAKTNSYVEEFSTSNFLAIDGQGEIMVEVEVCTSRLRDRQVCHAEERGDPCLHHEQEFDGNRR